MRRVRRTSSSATGATHQYPTGCVVFSGAAPSTSHARTSLSALWGSRDNAPSPLQIGILARCIRGGSHEIQKIDMHDEDDIFRRIGRAAFSECTAVSLQSH